MNERFFVVFNFAEKDFAKLADGQKIACIDVGASLTLFKEQVAGKICADYPHAVLLQGGKGMDAHIGIMGFDASREEAEALVTSINQILLDVLRVQAFWVYKN